MNYHNLFSVYLLTPVLHPGSVGISASNIYSALFNLKLTCLSCSAQFSCSKRLYRLV